MPKKTAPKKAAKKPDKKAEGGFEVGKPGVMQSEKPKGKAKKK